MKFAFGEFHLWYQVALSMVACGKVRRGVLGLHLPSQAALSCPPFVSRQRAGGSLALPCSSGGCESPGEWVKKTSCMNATCRCESRCFSLSVLHTGLPVN